VAIQGYKKAGILVVKTETPSLVGLNPTKNPAVESI
jgi:hypothetical protein